MSQRVWLCNEEYTESVGDCDEDFDSDLDSDLESEIVGYSNSEFDKKETFVAVCFAESKEKALVQFECLAYQKGYHYTLRNIVELTGSWCKYESDRVVS